MYLSFLFSSRLKSVIYTVRNNLNAVPAQNEKKPTILHRVFLGANPYVLGRIFLLQRKPKYGLYYSNYNHGQKSWDKFTFDTRQTNSQARIHLHLFSPSPPPPLQCWTSVHAISPEFQHCMGGSGGGKSNAIWDGKQCFCKTPFLKTQKINAITQVSQGILSTIVDSTITAMRKSSFFRWSCSHAWPREQCGRTGDGSIPRKSTRQRYCAGLGFYHCHWNSSFHQTVAGLSNPLGRGGERQFCCLAREVSTQEAREAAF